jgi:hypothetical protein
MPSARSFNGRGHAGEANALVTPRHQRGLRLKHGRMATALRWKYGDADSHTPSLFAHRRRPARSNDETTDEPSEPTPAGDETD